MVGAPGARDCVLRAFTAKDIWEVEIIEPKVAPAPLVNATMEPIIRLANSIAAILGCSSFQFSVIDWPMVVSAKSSWYRENEGIDFRIGRNFA